MGLKIIQVTSIPLQVTKDQMYTMFRCIGEIEDIRLYPTVTLDSSFNSRICFVKFKHSSCGETACYLNNTQIMEHTLQINPYIDDEKEGIPSEELALEILAAATDRNNPKCFNMAEESLQEAADKKLDMLLKENGLPPFPDLPNHYNCSKVEQIRRTLVVTNLSSSVSGQQVVDHFSKAGEVKYVRFCQRNDDPEFYALVELTSLEGIIPGLKLNNTEIVDGRQIKVYHSVMAIEKHPQENLNRLMQFGIPSSLLFEEDYAVILGQALKSESSCQSPAASYQSNSSEVHSSSGDTGSHQNDKSRSRKPSAPKTQHRHRSTSRNMSRSRNHKRSKSRHHNRSRSRNQNRSRSRNRNRSRSRNQNRSRSRNRNRSRSKNRPRPRNQYRSNSRHRDRMQSVQSRRSTSWCRYSSRSRHWNRSKYQFRSDSRQRNREKTGRQNKSRSLDSSRSRSQS